MNKLNTAKQSTKANEQNKYIQTINQAPEESIDPIIQKNRLIQAPEESIDPIIQKA